MFDASDIISIAALIVSIILFPISFRISKKHTDHRKIKDTLMDDLSKIRNDYRNMLNSLYDGKHTHMHMISWFKIANIKLNSINTFSEQNFKLKAADRIIAISDNMRIILMESDGFISTYQDNGQKSHVVLDEKTKSDIECNFASINDAFLTSMNIINYSKASVKKNIPCGKWDLCFCVKSNDSSITCPQAKYVFTIRHAKSKLSSL